MINKEEIKKLVENVTDTSKYFNDFNDFKNFKDTRIMRFKILNFTKEGYFVICVPIEEDNTISGTNMINLLKKVEENIKFFGWEKTDKYICLTTNLLPVDKDEQKLAYIYENIAYKLTYNLNHFEIDDAPEALIGGLDNGIKS